MSKYFAGALALVLLLAAAAACGGDDGGDEQTSGIRTQKGLSVAAITAGLGGQAQGGTEADDLAAPEAPSIGRGADGATRDIATDPFAPVPFAPAQQAADGLTVVGYGSATATADSAIVEFYFGRNSSGVSVPGAVPETRTDSSGSGSSGSTGAEEPAPDVATQEGQVAPITEADLQPVIDAIVAAGVAREDIEFIAQTYYDAYFATATLRVTVRDVNSVDAVVNAARNAVGGVPNVQLQSTNVSYTLQDCTALEKAAMQAAVDDAGDRAAVLAETLGVGIGRVTGASNYSYSPYGGTPCDTGYFGPYPLGGIAYAEGQAREVQVFVQTSVTYAIQ
jgi:uncharacterized protein YggE